jgi:short-subunit dehydrogenase
MNFDEKHCLVIGIGAGTGAACARRFANEGYKISMIARGEERLEGFAREIPNSTPYRADISDSEGFRATLRRIREEQGAPRHVIYNATQATFGTLLEIDTEKFERNFRVNATGLLIAAQELSPAMVEAGCGSIVVTGNTAALRGKANYVGWASTKAAQRNLSESLARELGPHGIHVAYVVIDAVIDMPFARRRWPDKPDDFYAKPDDLAAEIYRTATQPRSAWSFLVELRPFGEHW